MRLLYFAVALALQNALVYLKWVLTPPKRGREGPQLPPGAFPFSQFLEPVCFALRSVLGERKVLTQLGGAMTGGVTGEAGQLTSLRNPARPYPSLAWRFLHQERPDGPGVRAPTNASARGRLRLTRSS